MAASAAAMVRTSLASASFQAASLDASGHATSAATASTAPRANIVARSVRTIARDPRLLASAWIDANIPSGSTIATRRMYYDRPTVNNSKFNVLQLQRETCDTPSGA